MADGWLLKGIQDLVDKVKILENEKKQAVAMVQALEREKGQAAARVQELEKEKRQTAAIIEALERAEKQAAIAIEAFERQESQTATTIQELEREKKQAAITIEALERQVGEQGTLITLASEKVAAALNEATTDDTSQPGSVSVPVESKGLEEPVEPSPSQPKDLKRRFLRVFNPTEHNSTVPKVESEGTLLA
jgi:chromosome segregation ATPase